MVPLTSVPAGSSSDVRTVPRLRSRLPIPFERGTPWLARPALALRAPYTSATPAPTAIGSFEAACRAVDVRANLMRSGVHDELAWARRATAPDTTPVDIDVPLPL